MTGGVCVTLTILFTVYGQLVLKWQIGGKALPEGTSEKLSFLMGQFLNPWIVSGFVAAFVASLCWMAAMTKLPLSQAYPFMSLSFVLVTLLSSPLFGEPLTPSKVAGTFLLMVGLVFICR